MSERFVIEVRSGFGEDHDVYGIHANNGNRLIGHAFGKVNPDKTAVLESLFVDLCERGGGVGCALLQKFIECMISEGVTEITGEMVPEYGLHYDETARFYRKNGFEVSEDAMLRMKLQ